MATAPVPASVPLLVPFAEKDSAKAAARAAGGRLDWDPDAKRWSYVGSVLPETLERYRPVIATKTGQVAGRGKGALPPRLAADQPKVRTYVLDVPYPLREHASAAGARWTPSHKAYTYLGTSLPLALEPFKNAAYSWERRIEDEINGWALEAAGTHTAPTLRPHQVAGVKTILAAVKAKRTGFLLADDVGVGKTITTWAAVQEMPFAKRVLIACPFDVVAHWQRTVAMMGDAGKEVVVMNYERLQKLFEVEQVAAKKTRGAKKRVVKTPKRGRTLKGVARYGTALGFDVVVADESHRLKNPAAARSKLLAKLAAKAKVTLWLSATAGQNPLELSYLAPLLADVTGRRVANLNEFEVWCADEGIAVQRGAFGKWTWEKNDTDLEKMEAMLFGGTTPAGLRRRPTDIAGWPEINRILLPEELGPMERVLYDKAWHEFQAATASTRGSGKKDGDHRLVAQLRFRQKGSLLRVGSTVAQVLDLLENGRQVAVSIAFHETLEQIKAALEKDGLAVAVIHGQLAGKDAKERERLRYQRGNCPVVLFTVEEGISLHQGESMVGGNDVPRAQVIHDLRWSAIQMAQIEGRSHRDGKFAQMYWCFAAGTVEEQIARVVAGRVMSMKGMLGDDRSTMAEIEALLEGRRAA